MVAGRGQEERIQHSLDVIPVVGIDGERRAVEVGRAAHSGGAVEEVHELLHAGFRLLL